MEEGEKRKKKKKRVIPIEGFESGIARAHQAEAEEAEPMRQRTVRSSREVYLMLREWKGAPVMEEESVVDKEKILQDIMLGQMEEGRQVPAGDNTIRRTISEERPRLAEVSLDILSPPPSSETCLPSSPSPSPSPSLSPAPSPLPSPPQSSVISPSPPPPSLVDPSASPSSSTNAPPSQPLHRLHLDDKKKSHSTPSAEYARSRSKSDVPKLTIPTVSTNKVRSKESQGDLQHMCTWRLRNAELEKKRLESMEEGEMTWRRLGSHAAAQERWIDEQNHMMLTWTNHVLEMGGRNKV